MSEENRSHRKRERPKLSEDDIRKLAKGIRSLTMPFEKLGLYMRANACMTLAVGIEEHAKELADEMARTP